MERPYQLYTSEIPGKGIGYLTLEKPEYLDAAMEELVNQGALQVFATGALSEGEQDGLSIAMAHSMLIMERKLKDLSAPEGRLRLLPLTRDMAPIYIQLYNESFYSVANAATIHRSELEKLLRPQERAGIVWLETRPVGIYDCILEGPSPLIDGIGLIKGVHGQGLGRELLRSVLTMLREEGFDSCHLLVSTANQAAFTLYRTEGFLVTEKKSTWYEVRRTNVL